MKLKITPARHMSIEIHEGWNGIDPVVGILVVGGMATDSIHTSSAQRAREVLGMGLAWTDKRKAA